MSSGEGEDEVDFCFKLCSKDELASVWPGKCVYVVEEIIHTEQVYVTDLENIVKVSIMWNNICVYACMCICRCWIKYEYRVSVVDTTHCFMPYLSLSKGFAAL